MGSRGFLARRGWGCHHHNAEPPPIPLGMKQHLFSSRTDPRGKGTVIHPAGCSNTGSGLFISPVPHHSQPAQTL